MLNTSKKPLKSKETNNPFPSCSETLMVGKECPSLSHGFLQNCWSWLRRVASPPATPHISRLFPRPHSKPGYLIIWISRLLNISLKSHAHVEVDEGVRGSPFSGLFFRVLFISSCLRFCPNSTLRVERIWTGNSWPNCPIKATSRVTPQPGVVSAL